MSSTVLVWFLCLCLLAVCSDVFWAEVSLTGHSVLYALTDCTSKHTRLSAYSNDFSAKSHCTKTVYCDSAEVVRDLNETKVQNFAIWAHLSLLLAIFRNKSYYAKAPRGVCLRAGKWLQKTLVFKKPKKTSKVQNLVVYIFSQILYRSYLISSFNRDLCILL